MVAVISCNVEVESDLIRLFVEWAHVCVMA